MSCAQVAGLILTFGKDKDGKTIDYGSVVEEGTILAQIDDSLYAADEAQVAAQLQQAEANLEQMKAKLYQAQQDWQRAQKLGPSEALAQSSYDAYKSGYEIAKANITVGQANITQAKAALQRAKRNLSYCTIKSPVKGVIIDRRVNIGQTVVSSLNAPSLFLIAKDLKRMQVWVSVAEADIGNINPGQPVTFTVSAYPDEVFHGEVGKVRLNATMTQNVVTYTVEVLTDNSSGKLLPYLTAAVNFEVSRKDNVLMVPSAALQWQPQPEQISPEHREELASDTHQKPNPVNEEQSSTNSETQSANNSRTHGIVWVQEDGYVKPIKVRVGLTDDSKMTEISGNKIKQGLAVIIGEQQQESRDDGTTNPFTPQFRRSQTPSAR